LVQQSSERSPLDQSHREIGPQVGIKPELVYGKYAGMLELAADLGLLDKTLDSRWLPRMLRMEDLDGHVAADIGIAPLEDDAHPTASDFAFYLIAPVPSNAERKGTRRRRRNRLIRFVAQPHARFNSG